jgi:hypothetical protein
MAKIPSRPFFCVNVMDLEDCARKDVRTGPQPFTVVSNQTVHVDMDIDTGIR